MQPVTARPVPADRFQNHSEAALPEGRFHPDDLTHEHVVVTIPRHLGGGKARVDVGLARLLARVWALSWPTFASCEEWGDGTAQIIFDRAHDAIEFVASLPFGDRVQLKLMSQPLRRGPLVDRPIAVYFPIARINPAIYQLRFRLLAETGHWPLPRPAPFTLTQKGETHDR